MKPEKKLAMADGSAVKRARRVLAIFNRWRQAKGIWAERGHDEMPFTNADIGHALAAGNAALEAVDDLMSFFPANHPAKLAAEKRIARHLLRISTKERGA